MDDDTTTNDTNDDENKVLIDSNKINEFKANPEVIRFIKSRVPRLTKEGAQVLIHKLLYQDISIKASELAKKTKTFVRYNLGKFDEDEKLKIDFIKDTRVLLINFLNEIGKDVEILDIKKKKTEDVIDTYILDKNSTYEKIRNLDCDEGGDANFVYDFEKPDLPIQVPKNSLMLQYCEIQILSIGIKFDYPIEYAYRCSVCEHRVEKKAYIMISSKTKYKCEGIRQVVNPQSGEIKARICNETLYPEEDISITKDAYYYDINYTSDEYNKTPASAISFKQLDPGFYKCVLFKLKNIKKSELFQIMDVQPFPSNKLKIPQLNKDENYLFTLQKTFDEFIKQQTGMEIHGLVPVKIAMIVQTIISVLKLKLIANIQLVGDSSTGKSVILKYYGFLLSNQLNLSSNGISISIPALRGTRHSISLMGKEHKIISLGYLGQFKTIHIDEAGENKELIQNLKTFLLEENYGYDRAGATGVFNTRIAQINLSENLDYNHLGQYNGSIRKAYKDMNITIGDEERVEWNEEWDLHKPIHEYTNPYLRKVIRDKRIEYQAKQLFWIDGYDYALHERFPFYFYLVNKKKDLKLDEVVRGNASRDLIRENLELIKVLKCDDITKIFKLMNDYKESESDNLAFQEVEKILDEYGIEADTRTKEFYFLLLKVSRIANARTDIIEMDYNLLRWFLENTNRKLDVADMIDYKIIGPPNVKLERERDMQIDDDAKVVEDTFGLPAGEFD